MRATVGLFFLLAMCTSCTRYYHPSSLAQSTETIRKANSSGKFFILRDSAFTYAMDSIEVDTASNSISAHVGTVPSNHLLYIEAKNKKDYSFGKRQSDVLNEVHLFSDKIVSTPGSGRTIIPLSTISKIEEINFDKKRTKKQHTTVWLVTAGGILLLGLISAAAVGSAVGNAFQGN